MQLHLCMLIRIHPVLHPPPPPNTANQIKNIEAKTD